MRVTARALLVGTILVFLGATISAGRLMAQGSPEDTPGWRAAADSLMNAARRAEASGNLREALALYSRTVRYAAWMTRVDADTLHAVIFRTAARLTPAPALPDSAMVYEVRAQIALDSAKTPADFRDVAAEYGRAVLWAPWIPRFYYNLALTAEHTGDQARAADLYRVYLLSPQIEDRDAVRRKLIALDYERERALATEAADKKRFAAFDEWTGEWGLFLKYDPRNEKVLEWRCWLIESQCRDNTNAAKKDGFPDTASVYAFSRAAVERYSTFHWRNPGTIDLKRHLDTLYVEGRGRLFEGVITGTTVNDVKWLYVWEMPENAACQGYQASGRYPVQAAVATAPNGKRELHFTIPEKRTVFGDCHIWVNPEYQIALAKQVFPRKIEPGIPITATLGAGDLESTGGERYQPWGFHYLHGDKVRLDMISSAFRPHIYIFTLDENSVPHLVLEDNGSGENGNARIQFDHGCDTDYIVLAAEHERKGSKGGPYSLALTIVESPRDRGEQNCGTETNRKRGKA